MVTLSIVIPAFDERRKIVADIEAAARFLLAQGISGEIIVVDDGSTDGTAELATGTDVPPSVRRIVLRNESHQGKGSAIRTGILASGGEYAMFADSGLTVPFENALDGLRILMAGTCDIAHGSRRLPGSVIRRRQDWDRKLISRLFHWIAKHYLRLPRHLTDTQCGFKIYRGDVARSLYNECMTPGFLFDVEIILRATARGHRIVEFPVEWSCDRDSRLTLRHSSREVLRDLVRIRRMVSGTPAAPQA